MWTSKTCFYATLFLMVGSASFVLAADSKMTTPATNTLAFETNSAERVRIDSSGNVGIGTTNPVHKLDVSGGIYSGTGIVSNGTIIGQAWENTTYTSSSGSANFPQSYSQFVVGNSSGTDSRAALIKFNPKNSASMDQVAYFGAVSTTGASNYTPIFVFGQQTGANAYNERMRIDTSGNVGIGNASPDERLVVSNGSTTGKYTTSGWTHSSDIRLKRDITPLKNSLEKIRKLQGVEYTFIADLRQEKQIGLIAQQVLPIFPEIVKTDQNGFHSMVYGNLVAPLVESVKTVDRRVTELENENTQLKFRLDQIEKQLLRK